MLNVTPQINQKIMRYGQEKNHILHAIHNYRENKSILIAVFTKVQYKDCD